jgi:CheY-like chemotaxis protein
MSQHERLPNPERGPTEDSAAKILLIDDDENITRIVSKFLRKHGFEITITNSGEDGVRVASELVPDLVVCDLLTGYHRRRGTG